MLQVIFAPEHIYAYTLFMLYYGLYKENLSHTVEAQKLIKEITKFVNERDLKVVVKIVGAMNEPLSASLSECLYDLNYEVLNNPEQYLVL